MDSTLDIFKLFPDRPLWITAVQGLREAKEQMARLGLICPGEYFIYSQGKGVMARQPKEWAEVT